MYKTILVVASGGDDDVAVFDLALSIARRFRAHLDFYHVRISPDRAAALTPHVDFSQGAAIQDALDRLKDDMVAQSAAAQQSFRAFCDRNAVPIRDSIGTSDEVTASWLEETDDPVDRLTFRARHRDLVVIGRPEEAEDLRTSLVGQLILATSRPVVVTPETLRRPASGVAFIGWKETRESARAVAAAMPLLTASRRVILATVKDGGEEPKAALDDLTRVLAWRAIAAEAQLIDPAGRSVAESLHATAVSAGADFLVVGAYGHSRVRDLVFGGVTQSLLEGASLPVLFAHRNLQRRQALNLFISTPRWPSCIERRRLDRGGATQGQREGNSRGCGRLSVRSSRRCRF